MGCRAAVQLANQLQERKEPELSDFVVGIICLAYPLHLQDEKEKLRDGPLLTMKMPAFFISGTEDEMAEKKIFEEVLKKMPGSPVIHWLEGVGHSHTSRKAEQLNVEKSVCEAVKSWLTKLVRDWARPAATLATVLSEERIQIRHNCVILGIYVGGGGDSVISVVLLVFVVL